MEKYILINNFIDDETISYYLQLADFKNEKDSKVGMIVRKERKIRKDIVFSAEDSNKIDKTILTKLNLLGNEHFGIDLKCKERYKIGTYNGDEKGFYNQHTDTEGRTYYRKISVIICLSNKDDYQGGIFKFENLNKEFKFDKGDIIMFDSNLLHGVEPVLSGKRQVLIVFMWDVESEIIRIKREYLKTQLPNILYNKLITSKTITLIPPNSGPGNQIMGIKECLIIAKILDRYCIIPPIREHYIKSNTTYYNFNEIFNLKLDNVIIDNNNCDIINKIGIKVKHTIHPLYFKKPLLHESLLKSKGDEVLLKNNKIINEKYMEELKDIKDNIIVIKHLFNNLCISECGMNGCFTCKLNHNFEDIYKEICSKFDFSDYIKKIGNNYIESEFNKLDYISLHIRLPDMFRGKTIDEHTNNIYNKEKIYEIIKNIQNKHNKPLFIASNNKIFIKELGLNINLFNDIDKHESFIEQYICCKSDEFYYLNLENTRFNDIHNRSTWTSFVIDYRRFLMGNNNNINLRIQ